MDGLSNRLKGFCKLGEEMDHDVQTSPFFLTQTNTLKI